mmetsp:Transcript_23080/g.36757  ORF Transcript_23080/g.36757 Transcript_23080/m.36757 type:complete len:82 (+) Transcript_23080:382-627(+)
MRLKEKGQVVRWMTYWMTIAMMTNFEMLLGTRLLTVIPFYYAFKFGFVLWCQSPKKRGSIIVHTHMLAPFLKCHEAKKVLQ